MKLSNIFKHFALVVRHKHKVFINCAKCGIPLRGLLHDLSKFSPTEFFESVKYYQGNRSPIGVCRRATGISRAWLHHKGRNKHHFEYWTDYNPKSKVVEPVKMPMKYVAEMFCDRVAASKIYNGENYDQHASIEYFNRGKGRRIIHPETSDLLEELLIMLSEKGESYTFAHIRRLVKEEKGKA